jgi:hypothetical protein
MLVRFRVTATQIGALVEIGFIPHSAIGDATEVARGIGRFLDDLGARSR